jgi:hypothetical protein
VHLNTDDPVIVRTSEGRTLSGVIDIVADDASIFWLWLDRGGGRVAVHEGDDGQVWRDRRGVGGTREPHAPDTIDARGSLAVPSIVGRLI